MRKYISFDTLRGLITAEPHFDLGLFAEWGLRFDVGLEEYDHEHLFTGQGFWWDRIAKLRFDPQSADDRDKDRMAAMIVTCLAQFEGRRVNE